MTIPRPRRSIIRGGPIEGSHLVDPTGPKLHHCTRATTIGRHWAVAHRPGLKRDHAISRGAMMMIRTLNADDPEHGVPKAEHAGVAYWRHQKTGPRASLP